MSQKALKTFSETFVT